MDEWRTLAYGASALFRTLNFAQGLALVDRIGVLADEANHHPDVDLRYSSVSVRLMTHDVNGLSEADVELARKISAAARSLRLKADPSSVQDVQVSIDAVDIVKVRTFWCAVLGYREVGDEGLLDLNWRGPSVWFQHMEEERTQRNRLHVDVFVPHDQVTARVAAAIAAGGHLVSDEHAPAWWVVADNEGNEACLASWMGRE